jgi:hypothetical protein
LREREDNRNPNKVVIRRYLRSLERFIPECTETLIIPFSQILYGVLAVFGSWEWRHSTVWALLFVVLFVILAALAMEAEAEDLEGLDHIEVRFSEGVEPDWVPVGTFTELNASVVGTDGSNLTAVSEFHWEMSNDIVSWMPRAPNVIGLYPEWYGDLVVTVIATWRDQSISESIPITIVRTVVDVLLKMDGVRGPVCFGDTVPFNVSLLDWRDEPIREGADYEWQVETGDISPKADPSTVEWTIDELGYHTITVYYTYGPMVGAATYTLHVQRKLASLEVWPVTSEMELGSEVYVTVVVEDHTAMDATGDSDVSIEVTQGCVTALRWSWDASMGHLHIVAKRPGLVIFDVVADLDGSTVRTVSSITVTGELDEPELEYRDRPSDAWMFLVLMGFGAIYLVSLVALTNVARKWKVRRKALREAEDVDPD